MAPSPDLDGLLQALDGRDRAREHGTIGMVLMARFASHPDPVALQRGSAVPFLTLRDGLGVTMTRQVLEEYFGRSQGAS